MPILRSTPKDVTPAMLIMWLMLTDAHKSPPLAPALHSSQTCGMLVVTLLLLSSKPACTLLRWESAHFAVWKVMDRDVGGNDY